MIEQDVKSLTMVEQSKKGGRVWVNNLGSAVNRQGIPVRFGLHNRTKEENKAMKSADLIGITPVLITQDMVGTTVGVFTSYEIKKSGWSFTGKGREAAQDTWRKLILRLGGIAKFISSPEQIHE